MAETILNVAIEKAAEAREQGFAEITHYPMLWLELLAGKRSWKQIELAAYRSFHRSMTDREERAFLKKVKIATVEQTVLLQRSAFTHYSKALFCKRMKENPSTYDWDPLDIEFVNPHMENVSEEVKNEIQAFYKDIQESAIEGRRTLQRFMDESISYLDPDND